MVVMMGMVGQKAMGILNSLNVAGPILAKELKVSSRQKWHFIFRSAYIGILLIYTLIVWYGEIVHGNSNPTYTMAEMHQVGLRLLAFVSVFQFCALQLISPVLTCTAISDEITKGTLSTLLTTPITSLQIVLGKFLSKTLIMVLLVGITLPFLATLRVFGGIEWNLVVWLTALTLSSALFNAALGLFLSIYLRRAYLTILLSYITLGVLFFLIPVMAALLMDWSYNGYRGEACFEIFNPYYCFGELANRGLQGMFNLGNLMWPGWQCLMLLGSSVGLLISGALIVRRKVLVIAEGAERVKGAKRTGIYRPRRIVTDRPVLWRELHVPLFKTKRWWILAFLGVSFVLIWVYLLTTEEYHHVGFTFVYLLLVYLVAAVLPGTTITHEKETGSWEVLLASPLTGWQIAWGKALGSLRRVLPVSVLFFGHIVAFWLAGYIHPLALAYMVPLVVGPAFFLIGTGIWFGCVVKRTTTAVMLNLGLGLLLWAGLPLLVAGLEEISSFFFGDLTYTLLRFNPPALDICIFDKLGRMDNYRIHDVIEFTYFRSDIRIWSFTQWLFSLMGSYGLAGIMALVLAGQRIRKIKGSF